MAVGLVEAVVERFQMPDSGPDVLLRIEQIGNPQAVGRQRDELHQAVGAGMAGGRRVEVGFLVNLGGNQAPIESVFQGPPP